MKKLTYKRFLSRTSAARTDSSTRKCSAIAANNPDVLSLAAGWPNSTMFPFQSAHVTICDGTKLNLCGEEMERALQYSSSVGIKGLVEWIQKLQKKYHHPPLMKKSLEEEGFAAIVTCGSLDGLSKIFHMILEPGDNILVGNPCYCGIMDMLRPYGYNLLSVDTDEHGMRADQLRTIMKQWKPEDALDPESDIPKILYTIPSCSNPTGVTTPLARKREIYEIARKYDMLIVEDDPYFYLQFGELVPSYQSIDVDGRVLRSDSMSKVMSSGLRLGWVSGAYPLIERLIKHQETTVVHSSTFGQTLVAALLDSWGFDGFEKHINNVQQFYKNQRDALMRCLDKHMTGLAEWNEPQGGMFVWLKLKGIEDTTSLIEKRALERKVLLLPGSVFEVEEGRKSSYVRAAYSFASEQVMDEAFSRLSDLLKDELTFKKKQQLSSSLKHQ